MAESNVTIRFSTKDSETVIAALKAMGDEGQRALDKIQNATKGPTDGQKALNSVMEQSREKMRELAAEAGPVGRVLSSLGPMGVAAAAGIGATVGAVYELVKAGDEAERNQKRLEAVLRATGNTIGLSTENIREYADALSTSTMASSNDIQAASAVLATFHSIAGDTFKEVLALAQDMSAVGFGGMAENATRLARALDDPIQGMDALRRVGISFSAVQRDQIELLEKTGKHWEAQKILLAEVTGKVGGAGAAEADTLTGAFHALGQELSNAIEKMATVTGMLPRLKAAARGAAETVHESAGGSDGTIDRLMRQMSSSSSFANKPANQAVLQNLLSERGNEIVLRNTRDAILADRGAAKQFGMQNDADLERAAKASADALKEESEAFARNIEQILKDSEAAAKAAEQRAETVKSIEDQADAAQRLAIAYQQGEEEYARVQDQLKVEENLRKLGKDAKDAETESVKKNSAAIVEWERVLKEAQKADQDAKSKRDKIDADNQRAADEQQRAIEDAFRAQARFAQDAGAHITDAFLNMAEGAKHPFDNLLQYAKKTFEQIAAAALLNPIIVPMVTSLIGGIPTMTANGQIVAGGGSGLSGATSLVGGGAGLYGMTGGSSGVLAGMGGAAANWINGIGASAFGLSPGVVSTVGATIPAAGGIGAIEVPGTTAAAAGTTLTSILGVGALGALGGNLLASLFHMRNKTAATIGAGGGAMAGMAVGGPIGAVIGGLIGTLAGLFGPKPSDMTASYSGVATGEYPLASIGNIPGTSKFSAQNDAAAKGAAQGVVDFVKQLGSVTGGKFNFAGGPGFNISVGNRDGVRATFGDGQEKTFASADDLTHALVDWVIAGVQDVPADVATAIKHIDFHGDLNAAFSDLQFAKNFQDSIAAMMSGSLDIQKDAYTQAKTEVMAYIDQIRAFKAETEKLGLSTEQADAATKAFVKNLVGMATGDEGLTDVETAVKTLKGAVEALPDLLTEVGEAGYTAADILARGLANLTAAKMGDIQSRLNSVLGHGFLNDIGGALGAYGTDVKDLTALGASTDPAHNLLIATVRGIITNAITGAGSVNAATSELDLIKDTFASFPEIVALANDALAGLNDTLGVTQQAVAAATARVNAMVLDLANAQKSKASGLLGRSGNVLSGADDALLSLSTDSSLSGLGPEAQRNAMLAALTDAFGQSQSSDSSTSVAGSEKVLQLWQPFLEASKAYYRSGEGFYKDQALVKSILGQTKSIQQTQVDLLQAQVNRLDQLISIAGGKSNVVPIGGTTAGDFRAGEQSYEAARQQYMAANGGSDAGFTSSDVVRNVFVPLRDQLIGATTDPALLLKTIADAGQNSDPNLGASQAASAAARLHQIGYTGFANGGVVDGPTFAMLGEGRYRREAAIPLPDGRSVHAVVHDSGGGRVEELLGELIDLMRTGNREVSTNLSVLARNTASQTATMRRRAVR
jgi:hypothetical protein